MNFKKIALATIPLVGTAMAAYVPTYETADISAIAIDAIGTGGVQIVAFSGLIVLAWLGSWFYTKIKKY